MPLGLAITTIIAREQFTSYIIVIQFLKKKNEKPSLKSLLTEHA